MGPRLLGRDVRVSETERAPEPRLPRTLPGRACPAGHGKEEGRGGGQDAAQEGTQVCLKRKCIEYFLFKKFAWSLHVRVILEEPVFAFFFYLIPIAW